MRAPLGAAVRAVPVPVPDAGPTPTRRRWSGLAVVVGAVVATLAASTLTGLGIPGQPAATAVPLPPPIGSCLTIAADGAAEVVPCDEPHDGELAMSWRPGVAPVAAGPLAWYPHFSVTRSVTDPAVDTRCIGWTERYVGWDRYLARHDDDLWLAPEPLAVGRMVRAPLDTTLDGFAWTGCAVVTTEPGYVGTVRDTAFAPRVLAVGPRPDAVSVCLDGAVFVGCSQPHTAELIGSVNLTQAMMFARSVTLDHTADEVAQGCHDLAVERLGRADPTFGGRLEVVAESIWQQSFRAPVTSTTAWLIPDCLVRVAGGATLDRSLVEWGERPLPTPS